MKLERASKVESTCYVIHDKQSATLDWIEEFLQPHFNAVGIKLLVGSNISSKDSDSCWELVIWTEALASNPDIRDHLSSKQNSKRIEISREKGYPPSFENFYDCCSDEKELYHPEIPYFRQIFHIFELILKVNRTPYSKIFKDMLEKIKRNPIHDLTLPNFQDFLEEGQLPLVKKQPSGSSSSKKQNDKFIDSYMQQIKELLTDAQKEQSIGQSLKKLQKAAETCRAMLNFGQTSEILAVKKQIAEIRYIKQLEQDKSLYLEPNFEKGLFFENFERNVQYLNEDGLQQIFVALKKHLTTTRRPKKVDYFICSFITRILGNKEEASQYFDKLSKIYQGEGKQDFAKNCSQKSVKLRWRPNQLRFEFEQQIKVIASQSPQDKGPRCYLCYGQNSQPSENLRNIQKWIWDRLLPDLDLTGSAILFDQREKAKRSNLLFINEMDICEYVLLIGSSETIRESLEITKLKRSNKKVLILIYEKEFEKSDLNTFFVGSSKYDLTKNYFEALLELCTTLRGNELAPQAYIDQFLDKITKPYDEAYSQQIEQWNEEKKTRRTMDSILSPHISRKN